MINEELLNSLNSYLLDIISCSASIMQDIEMLDLNKEDIKKIRKMVSKLTEFKNKYQKDIFY